MNNYQNIDTFALAHNSAKHVRRALIWGPKFKRSFLMGAKIGYKHNIIMGIDPLITALFNEMYRVNKKGRLVKNVAKV